MSQKLVERHNVDAATNKPVRHSRLLQFDDGNE
jgi:hypothetical protein